MTEAMVKEELSIIYLSALCSVEGISFDLQRHDDDSTDAIIKKLISFRDGRKYESVLRVQLKATSSGSQYHEDEKYVTYRLRIKNYKNLRTRATAPIILAVLFLPEDPGEWIKWTREELMLRGRMFWISLQDAPERENENHVSVRIPKQNIVNSEALINLLTQLAEEA